MSVYHEFWHHLYATTSKTNWGSSSRIHSHHIHESMTQNWERDIKTTGGTLWIHSDLLLMQHHFNSAWYVPSFEPWWPGLKNLTGMQTEWLETKRVNTQHSVRIVVENKGISGVLRPLPLLTYLVFEVHPKIGIQVQSAYCLPLSWSKQTKWSCRITFGSWLLYFWIFLMFFIQWFVLFLFRLYIYIYTSKLLLTLMTLMMQCCCQNCFPCWWYMLYLFLCRSFSHFAMVSTLVLCCCCSASLSVCCLSFCWILSLSLSFIIIYPFIIHP